MVKVRNEVASFSLNCLLMDFGYFISKLFQKSTISYAWKVKQKARRIDLNKKVKNINNGLLDIQNQTTINSKSKDRLLFIYDRREGSK